MTVTEQERHELYEALTQTIGDHANTFMNLLPPEPGALATKSDLEVTEANFRSYLDVRLGEQTRSYFLGMAGLMTSFTAITLAAVHYLR
jgi:hypothetical protein